MPMPRLGTAWIAGTSVCLLSLCLAAPAFGQDADRERGIGQQLGERLDRLADEFREGWSSLRQAVNRMGVQGRVYSRLRWDKQIATAEIEVDVEQEGVVTLRGALPEEQAKRKAVELAGDTVGVREVIDRLSVRPAAAPSTDDAAP